MAAKYLLPCPHCDQSIEVGIPQAGQAVNCSACQQQTTAPRLGELRKLPPVGGQLEAAPKIRNRANSGMFVAGLLLALLGLGGAGGLYYYANTLIVDYNVEGAMDRIDEEVVDKMPPDELVAYYDTMDLNELGEWQEQPYVSSTRQGNILVQFSYVLAGIGVLGLVLVGLGLR